MSRGTPRSRPGMTAPTATPTATPLRIHMLATRAHTPAMLTCHIADSLCAGAATSARRTPPLPGHACGFVYERCSTTCACNKRANSAALRSPSWRRPRHLRLAIENTCRIFDLTRVLLAMVSHSTNRQCYCNSSKSRSTYWMPSTHSEQCCVNISGCLVCQRTIGCFLRTLTCLTVKDHSLRMPSTFFSRGYVPNDG